LLLFKAIDFSVNAVFAYGIRMIYLKSQVHGRDYRARLREIGCVPDFFTWI